MRKLKLECVEKYVEDNIGDFHNRRIQGLDSLKLATVLRRKNPYLFKAKYILTAEQLIKGLVDAHISSNEEAIFGNWLEGLAIFINQSVYKGYKSGIEGIDLEFERDKVRNIVAIKSGPNWGNASQIRRMRSDFEKAAKTIRTSNSRIQIRAINGCCYGADNHPDKGGYLKYCGQKFWEFISGNPALYVEIIEPLGHKAKEKNDAFLQSYAEMVNRFVRQFSNDFCDRKGAIDWKKLVQYNSADRSV
jgi:hypothetical protein